MGQKDYLIAFTLIALFSIAFISFAVNFGIENDAPINLGQDDSNSYYNSTATSRLESYKTSVNSSLEAFEDMPNDLNEDPDAEITTTSVTGAASVTKDVFSSTKDAFFLSFRTIFGAGQGFSIIFYTIIAVIAAISLLLLWKTVKGGNPE